MSDIEYSVIKSDIIKSFDCITDRPVTPDEIFPICLFACVYCLFHVMTFGPCLMTSVGVSMTRFEHIQKFSTKYIVTVLLRAISIRGFFGAPEAYI